MNRRYLLFRFKAAVILVREYSFSITNACHIVNEWDMSDLVGLGYDPREAVYEELSYWND